MSANNFCELFVSAKKDAAHSIVHSISSFCFPSELLQGDLRTDVFEGLLQRFGFFLAQLFLNDLRSSIDKVLRFLQAQAGRFTDDLDDLNLLRADLEELKGARANG